MKRFAPTIWLSFGLVSLTMAIALTAFLLGLMPDGFKAELSSRAKVAESLAIQLAGAANRNDAETMLETMDAVVERNDDVLSGALRKSDGTIITSAGDHETHWVASEDGKSTPTHISVPLVGPEGTQGTIEIAFGPPSTGKRIYGFPVSLLLFLAFLMSAGFIGYFLMLRRTLKQLDPGRVIPERVQKAFDTLTEGVIILDEKQRILLVNTSFAKIYGHEGGPAIGSKINNMPWRMVDGSAQAGGYPWHTALREGKEMREGFLSLRTASGQVHNFNVNATTIAGENDRTIGAIVTLGDMTNSNRNKEELAKAITQLKQTEDQVLRQKKELTYLSNHDTLSDCLNRRSFMNRLTSDVEQSTEHGADMTVLMIGLERFKKLNEEFGSAAGDRVVTEVARIIKSACGNVGYVARHNEDEFAVALVPASIPEAQSLATSIVQAVERQTKNLLANDGKVFVNVGISNRLKGLCSPHELIHRANRAMKSATNNSSERVVLWDQSITSVDSLANVEEPVGASNSGSATSGDLAQQKGDANLPVALKLSEAEFIQRAASAAQTGFFQVADHSIERAKRNKQTFALMHLSVVSWDYLIEALGEAPAQLLMRSVERQVQSVMRESDCVLLDGNNNSMLVRIDEAANHDDIVWLASRIMDVLRNPFEVGGEQIYVSCQAGIAVSPQDGDNAATLARKASIAQRRALQEDVIEGMKFYEAKMGKTSRHRLTVESGIREALHDNMFELYFQPIVDAKTGSLNAAECLLRCTNPNLKDVRIDEIIDVAEQSSLIAEIDMWVLKNALHQMQAWCDVGLELPKVSINVSARQLTNISFMDTVYESIKSVRFSPSRVQIEVTETAKMAGVEIAAPQLKRLQQLGVHIALDDFGTGQASLTYLQRLHPDVIKIDRSFITGVNTNHANATLVSAMTVMAHCLGLKVVVEGVETEDQLIFLRDTHCDEIQGYLISKPMPAKVMGEWMRLFVAENGTGDFARDLQPLPTSLDAEQKAAAAA